MAIFRGTGGSLDGLTESEVILLAISQGGTGSSTASGARTNLGLGTAATTDASAYATSAQGALADTAIQAADLGTAAYTDSTDYATAAQGTLADSAVQPGDLATVATTGSYTDLTDKPTIPTNLDSLTDVVITSATNGQSLQFNGTNWVNGSAGAGSVTSVALSVPTGLTVSGSPVTTSGTLAVSYDTGYAIPTTAKQTEWDTAYTDRNKWDGGATGLNAATGRTSLGLGTAATTASTDYATAAQGTKADTAYGWGNHALAGYLTTETYTGTVTSVAMTVPTGLSVSGTPITSTGTLAVTLTAGYSIPTTSSQTNWDTAYTDRLKWDGGSTGLTASTGRTSLGATTVGSNLFTLTDPSAVTFVRLNADNTVSALSASDFRTAIGAGTSSTTGTVTSVSGTGTVNGLSLSGTVTSSGNLTLSGTLDLSSPPAIGGTAPAAGTFTTLKVGSSSILGNANADVTLGLAVRNSGASMGYLQTYNSNAGTDLKTWRMGGNSSGSFVFETVNDAYSSATNRMTLDSSGNLTATTFNGTVDGGTY